MQERNPTSDTDFGTTLTPGDMRPSRIATGRRASRILGPAVALTAVALLPLYAALAGDDGNKETEAIVVTQFTGTCSGDNLSYGYECSDYFLDKMETWGYTDREYYANGSGATHRRIHDADTYSTGQDHLSSTTPDGVDTSDVFLFYGHGGDGFDANGNKFSVASMHSSVDNSCGAFWGDGTGRDRSVWGDQDVDLVIWENCESVEYDTWQEGGLYVGTGELMAILGFHGLSYDTTQHTSDFHDFVDTSRYSALGENWVDENTRTPTFNPDTCPISLAFGSTPTERNGYLYDRGLDDLATPTGHNGSTVMYYPTCHPTAGAQL